MTRLVLVLLIFISFAGFAKADDMKKEKHWYAGVGPAFSSDLIGTGGTKFDLMLGYELGMTERVNLQYFYDAAINTSSAGSTLITEFGAAIKVFQGDRGAETSPFLRIDVGYGGNNRYTDASPMLGVGIGIDLYRNKEAAIEILYRHNTTLTQATTNIGAYPNVDNLVVGVIF